MFYFENSKLIPVFAIKPLYKGSTLFTMQNCTLCKQRRLNLAISRYVTPHPTHYKRTYTVYFI